MSTYYTFEASLASPRILLYLGESEGDGWADIVGEVMPYVSEEAKRLTQGAE